MSKQSEFEPDGIVAARFPFAVVICIPLEAAVAILGDDLGRKCCQRIPPQLRDQNLGALALGDLRSRRFVGVTSPR